MGNVFTVARVASRKCAYGFRWSLLASLAASCATAIAPPSGEVLRRAQTACCYSGRLRVSLRGPSVRVRTRVLVAFERPASLRLEVPGPSGARLVAVANGEEFTAIFPAERAVFEGGASAADLEAVLGVALSPPEVMDLLVGVATPRMSRYRARWRGSLPRDIEARLEGGARLRIVVEDAEAGAPVSKAAFLPPSHTGYRNVDAQEARQLWSSP